MIFLDNKNIHDPRVNLAFEEYAIRHLALDDEILLFYINEPSIIVGRNQNTVEEINVDYVERNDIKVVRRLSGGGAVYHDLGNLNFLSSRLILPTTSTISASLPSQSSMFCVRWA